VRPTGPTRLEARFDGFLFAQIRDDRDSEPLSVVSALARLDLDPWAEAAALAVLPVEAAAQRLAALLAKQPVGSPTPDVSAASVRCLVALLPQPASRVRNSPSVVAQGDLRHTRIVSLLLLAVLATVAVGVLGGRVAAPTATYSGGAAMPPDPPAPAPARAAGR